MEIWTEDAAAHRLMPRSGARARAAKDARRELDRYQAYRLWKHPWEQGDA